MAGRAKPEQSPNPGSWVTQWFNGKSSFKTANPVSVPTTTTVPSINAAMVQGGSISGTVTGGGNPQQGICVAIDPGTPGGIVKVQTQTDNNGNYTLSNVAAGTYKVRQKLPGGWAQTTPANGFGINVTVMGNQAITGKLFGEKKIS